MLSFMSKMLKSFPETCHLLSDFVILLRHSGRLVPKAPFSHCVIVKPNVGMLQPLRGQKLHSQRPKTFECLIPKPFL